MAIGIPHAKTVFVGPSAFAVCPVCADRVALFERKDEESWSGVEYARHYEAKHAVPETCVDAAREFAFGEIGHWFVARIEVLHMSDRESALRLVSSLCVLAGDVEDLCKELDAVGAGALARDVREHTAKPRKTKRKR